MSASMDAERPVEKRMADSAAPAPRPHDSEERDVEDGPAAVNVDRIEKVYRCVKVATVSTESDPMQQA